MLAYKMSFNRFFKESMGNRIKPGIYTRYAINETYRFKKKSYHGIL